MEWRGSEFFGRAISEACEEVVSGTAIPPEIAANVRYWLRLLKKSGMRLLLSAPGYERTFVKLGHSPRGAPPMAVPQFQLVGDGWVSRTSAYDPLRTFIVLLPQVVEHWSLAKLREKLFKIGAKVVRHGRYVTFQMAEVAIPRALFAEILRLIKGQIAIYQSGLRPGSFTSSVVL